jgi:transposase
MKLDFLPWFKKKVDNSLSTSKSFFWGNSVTVQRRIHSEKPRISRKRYMSRKKELIRRIEELTEENALQKSENKQLKAENAALRSENAKLHERIKELESTLEEKIKQAVEEAVAKATAPLYAIITSKEAEILRLKSQIDKDSRNSSKPPSSNGFKKVPNNRERSGKRQGGQYGHAGTRFNIPENLEELVNSGLAEHIIINEVSEGDPYVSDWLVDIKIVTVFTEHRRPVGKPPQIEYGPWVKALAVYLNVIGLVSYKRLSRFFQEITYQMITISKATLESSVHTAAERITLTEYIDDLLDGNVINVDDTQIKSSERPKSDGSKEPSEHTTFTVYIRTYSNARTTVLTAHPHKTEESVITDNILTRFYGILAHDHEKKFYKFGKSHATCCAHLTRDLAGLSQFQLLTWAEDVRQFFLEMNQYKNNDILKDSRRCESTQLSRFEARYDDFVVKGKEKLLSMSVDSLGYVELRRMVNRLDKNKDSYLLFMRDYDAPFTNNQAERDLRHCKTKQKVSGCFRSWQGVLNYCRIRSFLDTKNKRKEPLLIALCNVFSQPVTAGQ